MTSPLTTRFSALLDGAYSALVGRGHAFNRLTTPELHYLASVLSSLRGSPASELTLRAQDLICGIANELDGGSRTVNHATIAEMLAAIIDAGVGSGNAMELENGSGHWALENGAGVWNFG